MKENNDIREILQIFGNSEKKALVRTFGCQLNVSDGEKIKGLLKKINCTFTEDENSADIIILNTCAVRENAEDRVFGIIGSMKKLKEKNPNLIIGITGCMAVEKHVEEKIKKSYPQVDFIAGTSALASIPSLILKCLKERKFVSDTSEYDSFSEIQQVRDSTFKASVPIMFGCNNFCTYCIVPYVRGRERSRQPEDIENEVRELAENGYREIMLLGQNVNSYGNDLKNGTDFPDLLRRLNSIDGDFIIRFMSSHPKDASQKLIDAVFDCEKVAKHLHLPVQSGSNSVLERMNRKYTVEKYMDIVERIRKRDPDFSLTTDLIVGFPNETDGEFNATLDIIRKVKYDNIYSFIYSKRSGTKASETDDRISDEEKGARMRKLLEVQREITTQNYKRFMGRKMRVLADGISKKHQGYLTGKSNEFIIVEFQGDESLIGQFVEIEVTETMNWAVRGKLT